MTQTPGQVRQSVVVDVDAALGNEAPQLVAAVGQGVDAVAGDEVAPRDVDVSQVRATLGQG